MTILRPMDYVLLADGTDVVIEEIRGAYAFAWDAQGYRDVPLSSVVHLHFNLNDVAPDQARGAAELSEYVSPVIPREDEP